MLVRLKTGVCKYKGESYQAGDELNVSTVWYEANITRLTALETTVLNPVAITNDKPTEQSNEPEKTETKKTKAKKKSGKKAK